MIDFFTTSVIIDDIVLPNGTTHMGVLGGGGPQTAFGMKLWAEGRVGLCGGVGNDFPAAAEAWLAAMDIDTAGVRRDPQQPSLRAWQIIEADGRRTQVWRTEGEAIHTHLALRPAQIPAAYWQAKGFHFGVHPEQPNLALVQALRDRGLVVSIEPKKGCVSQFGSCPYQSPIPNKETHPLENWGLTGREGCLYTAHVCMPQREQETV